MATHTTPRASNNNQPRPKLKAANPIADEHESLRDLMTQLREESDLRALGELLEEVIPVLEAHFRAEEQPGGLYDELQDHDPTVASKLDGLRAEHALLRTTIAALADKAQELQANRGTLLAAVGELVATLDKHEQLEMRLMTDGWYADLGNGD